MGSAEFIESLRPALRPVPFGDAGRKEKEASKGHPGAVMRREERNPRFREDNKQRQ